MFFFSVKVWFKIKTLSFGGARVDQNTLRQFLVETLIEALIKAWVEVLEAFTDVTKLDETFGLVESVQ